MYNTWAADEIFAHHNPEAGTRLDTIDLHGLFVKEAIARSDKHISACKRARVTRTTFITGKGNRSLNGRPVLKPNIEQHLRQLGLTVLPDVPNAGCITAEDIPSHDLNLDSWMGSRESLPLRHMGSLTKSYPTTVDWYDPPRRKPVTPPRRDAVPYRPTLAGYNPSGQEDWQWDTMDWHEPPPDNDLDICGSLGRGLVYLISTICSGLVYLISAICSLILLIFKIILILIVLAWLTNALSEVTSGKSANTKSTYIRLYSPIYRR